MTLAFWDSSAFVKLLVEEPGRDLAVELWNGAADVVASRLVVPEVSAALAAATRAGRVDQVAQDEARGQWARYLRAVDLVELTTEVGEHAAELAARYGLSGADAVHLASADALRPAVPVVVTWDHRLGAATVASGLEAVPGHF